MSRRMRTAALAAVVVLGLTGTAAAQAAPVGETVVTVSGERPVPLVSPDGGTLYVVAVESDRSVSVKVVDVRTGATRGQVGLGALEWGVNAALSADGSRLYVVDGQRLVVVDTVGRAVLATVALPDQPRPANWSAGPALGLAVGTDGGTVYVSQRGAMRYKQKPGPGRMLTFDTGRRAFTGSAPLPSGGAGAPVVRPGGQDLYIGTSRGIQHWRTAGPTLVGTVAGTVSAAEFDLAFSPDGTRLLALDAGSSGRGDLIDPATDTVSRHVTLAPEGSIVNTARAGADGSRFYAVKDDAPNTAQILSVDAATGETVPEESMTVAEEQLSGLAVGPDALVAGGSDGGYQARLHVIPLP
ncbi:hypothetical protein AB0C76_14625 [Kitasatospora sp. NPDC048722]|uniref:hypothetical protein n=1 Tax=Kitasatospora sp. NPDC048722 TaxID=3155639 RepID=UPI003403DA39